MTESLRLTETPNVALIHSLLNELVKSFPAALFGKVLKSCLEALRRQANPSTGLAQTALWYSMHPVHGYEDMNTLVMDTLALHTQGKSLFSERMFASYPILS
jgi:hypothetical protein